MSTTKKSSIKQDGMGSIRYEPIGEWDREVTDEEWAHMDKYIRALRTDTALRRKIELLERWGETGPPTGVFYMQLAGDQTALRRWYDPSLGLWSWKKPAPDSLTGRNRDIMERWSPALVRISNRVKGVEFSKSDRDALNEQVGALERQVAELIADKAWLEEQLALAGVKDPRLVKITKSTERALNLQVARTSRSSPAGNGQKRS